MGRQSRQFASSCGRENPPRASLFAAPNLIGNEIEQSCGGKQTSPGHTLCCSLPIFHSLCDWLLNAAFYWGSANIRAVQKLPFTCRRWERLRNWTSSTSYRWTSIGWSFLICAITTRWWEPSSAGLLTPYSSLILILVNGKAQLALCGFWSQQMLPGFRSICGSLVTWESLKPSSTRTSISGRNTLRYHYSSLGVQNRLPCGSSLVFSVNIGSWFWILFFLGFMLHLCRFMCSLRWGVLSRADCSSITFLSRRVVFYFTWRRLSLRSVRVVALLTSPTQNIFPSYSFYIRCAKLRHAWFRDGHQSSWTHMAILNTNSETGILEISWDHDCLTFTSSQDSVIPFPEFFQTFWEFTQQYLRGEVWNQSALLNFFQFLIYIMRKSEPPMDLRYEAISKGPEAMIGLISALVGTEHLRIQATVTPYALQFKKLK